MNPFDLIRKTVTAVAPAEDVDGVSAPEEPSGRGEPDEYEQPRKSTMSGQVTIIVVVVMIALVGAFVYKFATDVVMRIHAGDCAALRGDPGNTDFTKVDCDNEQANYRVTEVIHRADLCSGDFDAEHAATALWVFQRKICLENIASG